MRIVHTVIVEPPSFGRFVALEIVVANTGDIDGFIGAESSRPSVVHKLICMAPQLTDASILYLSINISISQGSIFVCVILPDAHTSCPFAPLVAFLSQAKPTTSHAVVNVFKSQIIAVVVVCRCVMCRQEHTERVKTGIHRQNSQSFRQP